MNQLKLLDGEINPWRKDVLEMGKDCKRITIVDDTHGHPGEDKRKSWPQELRTEEAELKPSSGPLSVHGLRERNQLFQVSHFSSVISGGLLDGCQKLLPLPVEDEPVWRLRDEEKDEHANAADDGDDHHEVLIVNTVFGNQSS